MVASKSRKTGVILRPIGCNAFEVIQNGNVQGTAFYQKARRRTSVETWAWLDRVGEATVHLNPGNFEDFRQMVKSHFVDADPRTVVIT